MGLTPSAGEVVASRDGVRVNHFPRLLEPKDSSAVVGVKYQRAYGDVRT